MGEHGTREQEVDDLLRHEVLVDLYRVVKQALRASVESYSIKAIEELYGFVRTAEVVGGDESTVLFEKWLESGDDALLDESRPTTRRTAARRSRSTSGSSSGGPRGCRGAAAGARQPEAPEERDAERASLEARCSRAAEEGTPRRLLAQLLDYHRREAKPQWWEWFLQPQLDEDELIEDTNTIGGLDVDRRARGRGQESLVYTFDVPRAGAQDRR